MNSRNFKPDSTRLSEILEHAPTNTLTRRLGKGRDLHSDVSGASILTFRPKKDQVLSRTDDVKDLNVSRRMSSLGIIGFGDIDLNAKQKSAISEHLDVVDSYPSLPTDILTWQRAFDYTCGEMEIGSVPIFYRANTNQDASRQCTLTESVLDTLVGCGLELDYASDSDNSTECAVESALYRLDRARATRYPESEVMALAAEIGADGAITSGSLDNDLLVELYSYRPEIDECLTKDTSLEDIIRICSCAIHELPSLNRSQLKTLVLRKLQRLANWEEQMTNSETWFYEDFLQESFTPPFDPCDWRETVEAFGALECRCGVRKVLPDEHVFAVSYKHERRSGLCRMTADTFFQITTALGEMYYPKVQLWIDTLNSVNLKERGVRWIDVGLAPYRKYKVIVVGDGHGRSERKEVTRLWLAIEMGLGYENRGLIAPKRVTYFNSPVGTLALEPKVVAKRRWQMTTTPVERTLEILLSKQSDKYRVTYDSDRLEIINYVRMVALRSVGGVDSLKVPVPVEDFDATVEIKVAMGISQPMKTDYDYRKEFGCVINTTLESEPCWKGGSIWSYSSKNLSEYAVPGESWLVFKRGTRGIGLGLISFSLSSRRHVSYAMRIAKLTNMERELGTGHVSSLLEAEGLFNVKDLMEWSVIATWTNDLSCYESMTENLSQAGLLAWLGPVDEGPVEVGHVPGYGIEWMGRRSRSQVAQQTMDTAGTTAPH